MLNINDYYFVCNACLGDYLNIFLNIKNTCFNFANYDIDNFKRLYDNYSNIDYDNYEIIPYSECGLFKFRDTIHNNFHNRKMGIDPLKTFGVRFNIKGKVDKIEYHLRHFELNEKNVCKFNEKVKFTKVFRRKPFYVFLIRNLYLKSFNADADKLNNLTKFLMDRDDCLVCVDDCVRNMIYDLDRFNVKNNVFCLPCVSHKNDINYIYNNFICKKFDFLESRNVYDRNLCNHFTMRHMELN